MKCEVFCLRSSALRAPTVLCSTGLAKGFNPLCWLGNTPQLIRWRDAKLRSPANSGAVHFRVMTIGSTRFPGGSQRIPLFWICFGRITCVVLHGAVDLGQGVRRTPRYVEPSGQLPLFYNKSAGQLCRENQPDRNQSQSRPWRLSFLLSLPRQSRTRMPIWTVQYAVRWPGRQVGFHPSR